MIENASYRQLSALEKLRITNEIKEDLVDHWYKAALTGVIIGFIASTVILALFYHQVSIYLISLWIGGFFLTLIIITVVDFLFKRIRTKYSAKTWNIALSMLVIICTMFWGSTVLFNPTNLIEQFILLAFLFMTAGAFSMTTVGLFQVCVIAVSCILLPVAVWMFSMGSFYYIIGGFSVLIYLAFLLGMNYRSTKWLIHSLELSKMLASFTHQANYDLVTDLPNQRLLTQYIEETLAKTKESGKNFALVSFGINRLDVFNNSLGYQAGDLVINSVAKRLETELIELSRFDDKERILTKPRPDAFVLLIYPVEQEEIEREINYLFLALDKPFHLGNRESRLTASVGITIFPKDSGAPEKLISNTYAAMFDAKSKGGNQIAFYKSTMTSNAPLLLELESDLDVALQKKELELYYQPLVDLQTKSISGVEALVRWNHTTRGLISPINFIPLAEETGLILPMGEWILEQAMYQTSIWHMQGFKDLKVAVNLSPKQLRQGNLIASIDKVLKTTKLDPHFLELELTETAMLDESLSPLIKEISDRGISLSIDDFGTGYSGLSYLKYFHVHKIKIDKSFIDDVVNSSDGAVIVTATLAMAKELGIQTLAEGVESRDQMEFLLDRGCQYIQGYYFSKPLTAQALEELLKKGIADKF